MPGSYFSDLDLSTRPSLHLATASARPATFLAPISSSATSSLAKSHSPAHHTSTENDHAVRKRRRHNDSGFDCNTTPHPTRPYPKTSSHSVRSLAECTSLSQSPAALVNTKYRIAGGLDTPSRMMLDADDRAEEDMQELDYRPNRQTITSRRGSTSCFPQTPALGISLGISTRKRAHSGGEMGWAGQSLICLEAWPGGC